MKRIWTYPRTRSVISKYLGESWPYIHGCRFDPSSSLGTKLVEETIETFGALALCPVDDLAGIVVCNQCQVVLILSIADLIHPLLTRTSLNLGSLWFSTKIRIFFSLTQRSLTLQRHCNRHTTYMNGLRHKTVVAQNLKISPNDTNSPSGKLTEATWIAHNETTQAI